VEVAKALGGSSKLVTLAPKTVREMTHCSINNNLASNYNLTRTTKRQTTHTMKTNNT